jgi:hypothetical protein
VRPATLELLWLNLLNPLAAIEHIKVLKSQEIHVRRDTDRLKAEMEGARRTADENRMLQAELGHSWAELRRLDPSRAHIYGSFTQTLSQEASRPAPGGHVSLLPPVQAQPAGGQWGQTSSGAMQGVEYPGPSAQHFEHR